MVSKIKEFNDLIYQEVMRHGSCTHKAIIGKVIFIVPLCRPVPFYSALGLTPILAMAATIPGITDQHNNIHRKNTLAIPLNLLKGKETFLLSPPPPLLANFSSRLTGQN